MVRARRTTGCAGSRSGEQVVQSQNSSHGKGEGSCSSSIEQRTHRWSGPHNYCRTARTIVERQRYMRIYATETENEMGNTCRIVRLEEKAESDQSRQERDVAVILDYIGDRDVTPYEYGAIFNILQRWQQNTRDIVAELGIVADGAELVRTLASTFAITPTVDRKLREKGCDYRRLTSDDIDLAEAA